jgi:hypothetical protein
MGKNTPNQIKEVSVFCDYAADGLWVNGIAADLNDLLLDLDVFIDDFDELNQALNKWQTLYESFELFRPDRDLEKIKTSDDYKTFEKLGVKIVKRIREIVPDDIPVYYWDEIRFYKFEVLPDGTFLDVTPTI